MTTTVTKVTEVVTGLSPLHGLPTALFVTVVVLVVALLIEYDVLRLVAPAPAGRARQVLASAAAPLLVAFALIVIRRFLQIWGAG